MTDSQPAINEHNKHPIGCEAQLACKCLFTSTFTGRVIFTRKVRQTELVFGVQSGFISRSVHASLCVQQQQFVPTWLTSRHTDRQTSRHKTPF